jgi:hypothetical protein
VRLEVESPADGVLVNATNHARGWRAELDGVEVPLLRVDGFLQGVALPAGRHEVRFRYRPRAFFAGAAISALTLAGLTALCLARKAFGARSGTSAQRSAPHSGSNRPEEPTSHTRQRLPAAVSAHVS